MPDDLRAAIEEAVSAYTEPDTLGHRVERVLEILADPVRRLAILDAMGLDVTEGWIHKGDEMHTSVTMFCRRNMTRPADWRSVLVVRTRGKNDVTTPWVARDRPISRGPLGDALNGGDAEPPRGESSS